MPRLGGVRAGSLGQLLRGGGIYIPDAVVDSARELRLQGKGAKAEGAQGARQAGAGVGAGSGGTGGAGSGEAICATPRLQRGLERMIVQLVCFGQDTRAVQAAAEVMAR